MQMAELVKWLTRRIVAPVCVGSIPTFHPIVKSARTYRVNIVKVLEIVAGVFIHLVKVFQKEEFISSFCFFHF